MYLKETVGNWLGREIQILDQIPGREVQIIMKAYEDNNNTIYRLGIDSEDGPT